MATKGNPKTTPTASATDPLAALPGSTAGFAAGSSVGSKSITYTLPNDIARRAGMEQNQLTGIPSDIARKVAGNPALRDYFQALAQQAGKTLVSNRGKFSEYDLSQTLLDMSAGGDISAKGFFNAAGSLAAAATKKAQEQAINLQDQTQSRLAGAANAANLEAAKIAAGGQIQAANIGASAAAKSTAANSLETFFANYGIDASTVPPNLLNGFIKDFTDMVYKQNITPTSQTTKELFQNYDGGKLYEAAFPGLTEYNNSPTGQTAPMTMGQFAQYRQQFKNLASTYNLPPGFLNDATLKKMVAGGVSIANLTDRIAKGYAAYEDSSPAEKQLLAKEYGISPGQAVAYFLDTSPGKAHSLNAIKQAMTAAPLELKAQQVGLTGFGQQQAEQLSGLVRSGALGQPSAPGMPYDFSQAYAAETQAARDAALTQQRIGQAPGTRINTDTLLGSQVAGYTGSPNVLQGQTQVQAQQAVQKAEQAAAAPFEKGGGYVETQKGVIGAGSAQQ